MKEVILLLTVLVMFIVCFFVMGKKMKNSAGDIGVFKQKVLFML